MKGCAMGVEKGSAFLLKVGDGNMPATYATVAGMFTGSAAEVRIRNHALSGTIDQYELSFESGERMRGRFLVTRLDYAGDYNGERNYALSLESSGAVVSE